MYTAAVMNGLSCQSQSVEHSAFSTGSQSNTEIDLQIKFKKNVFLVVPGYLGF